MTGPSISTVSKVGPFISSSVNVGPTRTLKSSVTADISDISDSNVTETYSKTLVSTAASSGNVISTFGPSGISITYSSGV